jgi:hypothetical protein
MSRQAPSDLSKLISWQRKFAPNRPELVSSRRSSGAAGVRSLQGKLPLSRNRIGLSHLINAGLLGQFVTVPRADEPEKAQAGKKVLTTS